MSTFLKTFFGILPLLRQETLVPSCQLLILNCIFSVIQQSMPTKNWDLCKKVRGQVNIQCTCMLTVPLSLLYFISGLSDHVHPSPGDNWPDQLFLRQQHGASREPRDVCTRCLGLLAGGQLLWSVTLLHVLRNYSNCRSNMLYLTLPLDVFRLNHTWFSPPALYTLYLNYSFSDSIKWWRYIEWNGHCNDLMMMWVVCYFKHIWYWTEVIANMLIHEY